MSLLTWHQLEPVFLKALPQHARTEMVAFARQTWQIWSSNDYASFETPRERLRVVIHALALIRVVRTFLDASSNVAEDLTDWSLCLGADETAAHEEARSIQPDSYPEDTEGALEILVSREYVETLDEFLRISNLDASSVRQLHGEVEPSDPSSSRLPAAQPTIYVIGIDLAWSAKNATGLAAAVLTADGLTDVTTELAYSLDDILQFIKRFSGGTVTVSIDAPTVVPHWASMRACEKLLQQDRELQRAHGCPYPGTRERLGMYNDGRPRGEELVQRLTAELAFNEVGCPPARHTGRYVMEVFPAAALVKLFKLTAPLVYKKKSGRSWAQCHDGLAEYLDRLSGLVDPRLHIPAGLGVTGQIGRAFKDVEDQVDAVLCAYVAALAWLGRARCVGTLDAGYIVLPASADASA